jgi:CheY-like chemotaxis protein
MNILVVDDDNDSRTMLATLLEGYGYERVNLPRTCQTPP